MAQLDENFVCGRCGGILQPIGEEDGQTYYRCSFCKIGKQYECPICHNPRTIWQVYREICFICGGGTELLKIAVKEFCGG